MGEYSKKEAEAKAEAQANEAIKETGRRIAYKLLDPTGKRSYGFWLTIDTQGVYCKYDTGEKGSEHFKHDLLKYSESNFEGLLRMQMKRIETDHPSRTLTKGEFQEQIAARLQLANDSGQGILINP